MFVYSLCICVLNDATTLIFVIKRHDDKTENNLSITHSNYSRLTTIIIAIWSVCGLVFGHFKSVCVCFFLLTCCVKRVILCKRYTHTHKHTHGCNLSIGIFFCEWRFCLRCLASPAAAAAAIITYLKVAYRSICFADETGRHAVPGFV